MNQHLDDEAKQENNAKYTAMVNAYDTLKDIKRKRAYDQSSSSSGEGGGSFATTTSIVDQMNITSTMVKQNIILVVGNQHIQPQD